MQKVQNVCGWLCIDVPDQGIGVLLEPVVVCDEPRDDFGLAMDSAKANDLRGKSKEELRAIEAKLSAPKGERHERVYIPAGDEHINNPEGKGRAFSSLYHLLKIRDVAETKPPPETSKGLFKYGAPVDEVLARRTAKATRDETDE